MPYPISAVPVRSYHPDEMRQAVRQHFQLLDIPSRLHPEMRVLLKPNLLMRRVPQEGTTTHPALVHAVVVELQQLGITKITIADSPGGPYKRPLLESVYAATGMTRVALETGVRVALSTNWETVEYDALSGIRREFAIIRPVCDADFIINLPKLKTHAMAVLSGGVKNLFGCVPGLQKPEMHFRFPELEQFCTMLIELARLVNPSLTIVDAVTAMEGDGPSAGTLRDVGWTVASDNVFALDLALCHMIGLSPEQVETVRLAIRYGYSPLSVDELEFRGAEPPVIRDYKMPTTKSLDFAQHLPYMLRGPVVSMGRHFAPRPVVRKELCVGCGKCAESCPAMVIGMEKGKARIRYGGCIRCFCCHEMCPVRAIDIRRVRFWKM